MKFKITFIDIGRNNHNSGVVKEFDDLYSAQEFAYNFGDGFLMSSNTSLNPTKEKNVYNLSAGFRDVGTIKIKEIKDENKN